jgi:predicted nuclease of predicted toxin-antitoxin system
MKFLADQDVWKATVDLLRAWGHDVITASELDLARASDEELLKVARSEDRILVTRDSDFGSLVFLGNFPSAGVVFLRIEPQTQDEVHMELQRLLSVHREDELRKSFCSVEPGKHRVRRIL